MTGRNRLTIITSSIFDAEIAERRDENRLTAKNLNRHNNESKKPVERKSAAAWRNTQPSVAPTEKNKRFVSGAAFFSENQKKEKKHLQKLPGNSEPQIFSKM